MTKKPSFIAQVATPSPGVEYAAAGGGGLLDPGEIAEGILPRLKGGPLFAYLFRRFGYPHIGWDDHKELVTYLITTPMKDVFLRVTPYMGRSDASFDSSCLMFGYCIDKAIAEEYYTLLRQGSNYDEWEEHPRYKALALAFEEAMRDLKRPVYVRDIAINCYGQVSDEEWEELPEEAPAYHAAGYPIPKAFLKDTECYIAFTKALVTLGEGSTEKGMEHVIKAAETVKLYTTPERSTPQP